MYGWGVIKTFWLILLRFVMTYVDDFKHGWSKRYTPEKLPERQGAQGQGIFTIQYPAEHKPLPARARVLPYLVIDPETDALRCTACGVCVQACPVQCIWMKPAVDPETGHPLGRPESYHVDIGLCMGCGYCEEFCPFEAVKMDSEYELSTYTRPGLVGIPELAKKLQFL